MMETTDVGETISPSYDEMRRAALAACSASTDLLDAESLLDCLGLLEPLRPVQIPA